MKKMMLTCLFVLMSAAVWAQNVINYQFQKGQTATYEVKSTNKEGKTTTAKMRLTVLDANDANAKIEFNVIDLKNIQGSSQQVEEIIQQFTQQILSASRTVVSYENGQPKHVENLEEIRASVPKLMNDMLESMAQKDQKIKESSEMIKGVMDQIVPIIQASITDQILIQSVNYFIASNLPNQLGESTSRPDDGIVVTTVLKPTGTEGEYSLDQTSSISLDKAKLQLLADGQLTDSQLTGALSEFLGNESIKNIISMLDKIQIDSKKTGVIQKDGMVKSLKTSNKVTVTVMGESVTETETSEITKL